MPKKVLIFDDDPLNRRFFKDVLTSEGYDAIAIEKADEAASRAREEMPDLIVMDMCMPEIDGIEATRRLKQDEELADIPIIGVTALARVDHIGLASDDGFAECLRKPVSIPGLLRSVGRRLN